MRGSRGVKGGLHPPYPGKSTLVKFPLKIIENRIRPLPLSPDKHNINSLDPPSPRNYYRSAHVHEPQKKVEESNFIVYAFFLCNQMQCILNIHITVNRFQTRTATPVTGRPTLALLAQLSMVKPA